ncbi:MAG: hypothetical protein QGH20_11445, partial [Candidatus Latescibacteria bacterium]|nr:hypothetical protein [Candidatus Latescibacterota bacterium]
GDATERQQIGSMFFGGGTPSYISPQNIQRVLDMVFRAGAGQELLKFSGLTLSFEGAWYGSYQLVGAAADVNQTPVARNDEAFHLRLIIGYNIARTD